MKTRIFLFVAISILLITSMTSVIVEAQTQADCNAYHGASIPDNQIDGVIGPEWNDAGSTNTTINPQGLAEVWTKQDGTDLYVAIRFQADSPHSWVALQFGQDFCMSPSADGAVFGDNTYASDSTNGYCDIHFTDNAAVAPDTIQNGVGAIAVSASNLVVVELKKPLNSGDTAGKDINWSQACSYPMVIMWDSNGGGSSGGTVNHAGGTPLVKTLLISPESNPVPEFPTSTVIVIAAMATVFVAFLTKRYAPNKPATK